MKNYKLFISISILFFLVTFRVLFAANITWDSNAGGAGCTDGAGTWLNANQWWDGGANVTWNNTTPDSAIIGNGGNGGTITLGVITANSVIFTNFSGTYILSNGSITNSGGIIIADNAGSVTISTPAVGGSGGIIKNGSGYLNMNGGGTKTYTGSIVINGGVLLIGGNLGSGNLTINNGILEEYWTATFNRALGTGANQFQILGGTSGFSGQGGTPATFGNSGTELVWGSTYFQPNILVLQSSTANANGKMNFNWKLDLNGSTRTITLNKPITDINGYANMASIIRNTVGTAGIIKTGVGQLRLSAANTYNGGTTINNGMITANNISALGSGAVVISNATLKLLASLTITNLEGDVLSRLDLGMAGMVLTVNEGGTNTFAGSITNGGSLVKSGAGMLMLSGTNMYTGATIITNGILVGVVGGYCTNSDIVVSSVSSGAFGILVTNNVMKWVCKSLTTGGGGVPRLIFDFSNNIPSAVISPLNVVGAVNFTVTPKVVVTNLSSSAIGMYPLMTWGSTTGLAPTNADLSVPQYFSGGLNISGNTLYVNLNSGIGTVIYLQ